MLIKMPIIPMILKLSLLVMVCVFAVDPRKLDETTTPAAPAGEKCTPCGNSSPPPSPVYYPSPSPPPPYYPSPPPPSPPPPPKKTPSSQYCPPPPPSSYMYITGPPGNLYPVDENFNGATRRSFSAAASPLLVGLLGLLALW